MTSHAAVVARGMGKPCVVGCGALEIDVKHAHGEVARDGSRSTEGDWLSIDGSTGEVILGELADAARPRSSRSLERHA